MDIEDIFKTARTYCEEGKVRVFALTEQGPYEIENPTAKLSYIFSEELFERWIETQTPSTKDSFYDSEKEAEKIPYKNPLTITISDFDPILSRIHTGTTSGIQIADISYSKIADLLYYKHRSNTTKKKIESGQQVNEEEYQIYESFHTGKKSGMRKLDSAKTYCKNINLLYNAGLLLSTGCHQKGIHPLLGICIDTIILEESEKRIQRLGINEQDITKNTLQRFITHKELLEKTINDSAHLNSLLSNSLLPSFIFLQQNLPSNPLPRFGGHQSCPTRAAAAIEEFVKRGCTTVTNFYVEDDMSHMKTTPHYERIERGMLIRTEQGDTTVRSNIYLGKRNFITIHGGN